MDRQIEGRENRRMKSDMARSEIKLHDMVYGKEKKRM